MIEEEFHCIFAGSPSDITEEELIKKVCARAKPAIEKYLSDYQPKELILREWLAQPLLEFAHAKGLSTRLIAQLAKLNAPCLGHVIIKTHEELLAQKGLGKKLLNELVVCLKQNSPKVIKFPEEFHYYNVFTLAISSYYVPGSTRQQYAYPLHEYYGFFDIPNPQD